MVFVVFVVHDFEMLISREMVLNMDIALNEAMFGGDMMARMDKVAGITASLLSRNQRFSPVRAGEIIEFFAVIAQQGTSGMTPRINVQVYEPVTDLRRDVTSGEFVMVAVDEALRPEPILWKPDMVQAAALKQA